MLYASHHVHKGKGSRAANARAEGATGSNSLAVSSRSSLLPSFVNASGYRDVSATRQGLWFLSESMCRMHERIALCKICPIAQGASRCASNNADSHRNHRAVHPLLITFRMSFGGVLLFRRFCVLYCACKFQQFLVHGLHLPTGLWLYRIQRQNKAMLITSLWASLRPLPSDCNQGHGRSPMLLAQGKGCLRIGEVIFNYPYRMRPCCA